MPSDAVLKAMNSIHRAIRSVTGGRVGWSGLGMPVVELTTTGRRSGEPRTVLLTAPVHDGDTYVLVASRGGDDTHPAWFLNLRDDPHVRITTKDGTRDMVARVAGPEERAELWPRITAAAKNYAGYQRKTDREIPVVVVEPAGA